jgi:hypothetical protein
MALAHLLAEAGHAPRWIETRARVHLRLVDGQAEVAVEVASAARNPVDAPAHPLPVGEKLLGGEQQRGVPGLQVGHLGASVSVIEEQTGQPASQDGPNMKW